MHVRRTTTVAVLVAVVATIAVLVEPTGVVRGRLTGEDFFQGRPTSFWRQSLGGGPAEQSAATESLASADAVPVLRELLSDRSRTGAAAEVRALSVVLLTKLGPDARAAEPELLAALNDPDPHLPAIAATSLTKVGVAAEQAVPALIPLLDSPHSAVVSRVLSEYKAQAKTAVPALVRVLADRQGDSEARWNAARTLGKIGPDALETVPLLIECLDDADTLVREHAAEAMGDIGPTAVSAVPALVQAFGDPAPRVRRDAVRSLGQMGEVAREAVPEIRKLLEDPEKIVRQAASAALLLITGEETSEKSPG